ncbi:MAG: hypothetical protein KF725_00455 [Cyclobacteriaceae bacterium]|nr:hypothetical protein [Cyclobacteriaceae bacterium]UYN87065.1 MAG: hypothetical protein KIT51_01950 [Cyclobacteriaceae bacterium]
MICDIEIPEVKNVSVAITCKQQPGETAEWSVYLINKNPFPIENTLVASKGYGEKDGQEQQTSVLRHFIETVPAHSAALVEPIDPAVFHLDNEYWVSYYIGTTIFDKRFVFVPDSIREENLIFIKELNAEGVLHS